METAIEIINRTTYRIQIGSKYFNFVQCSEVPDFRYIITGLNNDLRDEGKCTESELRRLVTAIELFLAEMK